MTNFKEPITVYDQFQKAKSVGMKETIRLMKKVCPLDKTEAI